MKTDRLVLSSLHITEDEYHFKGQFILNAPGKSRSIDIEDLEKSAFLEDLKSYFSLEESIGEIKNTLMDMIIEKAHISSKIVEGEDYEESAKKKRMERLAKNLDMS